VPIPFLKSATIPLLPLFFSFALDYGEIVLVEDETRFLSRRKLVVVFRVFFFFFFFLSFKKLGTKLFVACFTRESRWK